MNTSFTDLSKNILSNIVVYLPVKDFGVFASLCKKTCRVTKAILDAKEFDDIRGMILDRTTKKGPIHQLNGPEGLISKKWKEIKDIETEQCLWKFLRDEGDEDPIVYENAIEKLHAEREILYKEYGSLRTESLSMSTLCTKLRSEFPKAMNAYAKRIGF